MKLTFDATSIMTDLGYQVASGLLTDFIITHACCDFRKVLVAVAVICVAYDVEGFPVGVGKRCGF